MQRYLICAVVGNNNCIRNGLTTTTTTTTTTTESIVSFKKPTTAPFIFKIKSHEFAALPFFFFFRLCARDIQWEIIVASWAPTPKKKEERSVVCVWLWIDPFHSLIHNEQLHHPLFRFSFFFPLRLASLIFTHFESKYLRRKKKGGKEKLWPPRGWK